MTDLKRGGNIREEGVEILDGEQVFRSCVCKVFYSFFLTNGFREDFDCIQIVVEVAKSFLLNPKKSCFLLPVLALFYLNSSFIDR